MKNKLAGAFLLFLFTVGLALCGDEVPQAEPVVYEPEPIPYYMTEEYQEAKRREAEEARRESEALRKSIEEYNAAMERQAEEEFRQMQEEYRDTYYEIPEEYQREGGSLPRDVQDHLFDLCEEKGVNPAVILAMIEVESGYRDDIIGPDQDSGYMQIIPRFHKERIKELGVTDVLDPKDNISLGVEFIAELLGEYDGNYSKALTAYNAGRAGAYKYWFSAGVDASPYAKKVLKAAGRIEDDLGL